MQTKNSKLQKLLMKNKLAGTSMSFSDFHGSHESRIFNSCVDKFLKSTDKNDDFYSVESIFMSDSMCIIGVIDEHGTRMKSVCYKPYKVLHNQKKIAVISKEESEYIFDEDEDEVGVDMFKMIDTLVKEVKENDKRG